MLYVLHCLYSVPGRYGSRHRLVGLYCTVLCTRQVREPSPVVALYCTVLCTRQVRQTSVQFLLCTVLHSVPGRYGSRHRLVAGSVAVSESLQTVLRHARRLCGEISSEGGVHWFAAAVFLLHSGHVER